MNVRVWLLIPVTLLLFSFSSCKKDNDVKTLKLESILGVYEGEEVTKMTLGGTKVDRKEKLTVTVTKSDMEGIDGTITINPLTKLTFTLKDSKDGKLNFEIKHLLGSGNGYFTDTELHYTHSFANGTEEFVGKKK